MADAAKKIGPDLFTVCLDFDERAMRVGLGSLAAVKTLRDAGIVVNATPGPRTGIVIALMRDKRAASIVTRRSFHTKE